MAVEETGAVMLLLPGNALVAVAVVVIAVTVVATVVVAVAVVAAAVTAVVAVAMAEAVAVVDDLRARPLRMKAKVLTKR